MNKIVALITCLFSTAAVNAQTRFLNDVNVEYEKVVYVKPLLKDFTGAEHAERRGNDAPQSLSYYYDFTGTTEKSVYKPGPESGAADSRWDDLFGSKNIVVNDYLKQTFSSYTPVYGESFLVEDSLLNIKWKLTADTRMIADFECRKATGILNDSIAIFAFYTDDILVTGGPERIQGLPGLILGVGIPRLHTTWFATMVQVNTSPIIVPAMPKKHKKVSYKALVDEVNKVLKSYIPEALGIAAMFMI